MIAPILAAANIFSKKEVKKSIVIQLKDKIDEKVFNDILVKEGLTKISIEIKNSEKSNIYNFFTFEDEVDITDIAPVNIMWLDAENSCININLGVFRGIFGGLTVGMKRILFREKILDEVYDKSGEYENSQSKYEANTDDIIEKIECRGNIEPYNLFIIKHFIKFVMDKYKEENISSEDNSANENNEDNKNITTNPFITNGE